MLIIDRFEGDYAVCEQEDRTTVLIRLIELPAKVREGDVIVKRSGKYVIDSQATLARRKKIEEAARDLWE